MGFIDKLKFWKKDTDIDLTSDIGAMERDLGLGDQAPTQSGLPDMGQQPGQGMPAERSQEQVRGPQYQPESLQRVQLQQQPQRPQAAPQETGMIEKDVQLILSRLDYIRSSLDNLNQRMENLERMARGEQRGRW